MKYGIAIVGAPVDAFESAALCANSWPSAPLLRESLLLSVGDCIGSNRP